MRTHICVLQRRIRRRGQQGGIVCCAVSPRGAKAAAAGVTEFPAAPANAGEGFEELNQVAAVHAGRRPADNRLQGRKAAGRKAADRRR